jgi:hypothetical protein
MRPYGTPGPISACPHSQPTSGWIQMSPGLTLTS